MFKILILAYVIGQSPVDTMRTFQMERTFDTMQECKAELLFQDPVRETYDVMWEFINDTNFKYDWLLAGCKNEATGEEFIVQPSYPKGKPKELQGLDLIPGLSI